MSELSAQADMNDMEAPSSLMTKALLLKPRHLVSSPFLHQLPFLFWLIEASQPRTVVQLGLDDGLIYMAVCQAIDRFCPGSSCIGAQPQPPLLSRELKQIHNAEYAEFSILLEQDIAADRFPDIGGIDLLIVNGDPVTAQTDALITEWAPRLSAKAVVVLFSAEKPVKEDALRTAGPSALITRPAIATPTPQDGTVFEACLYGTDQNERLTRLAPEDWNATARIMARHIFNRLGDGVAHGFYSSDLKRQHQVVLTALRQAHATVDDLQTTDADLRSEIDQLRRQNAVLTTTVKADRLRLETEMAAMTAAKAAHQAQSAQKAPEVAAAPVETEAHRAQVAELRTRSQTLSATVKELREAMAANARQIADLKKQLKTAGTTIRAQKQTNADLIRKHAKAIDDIHASRSWRVTRPLRRVTKMISRR